MTRIVYKINGYMDEAFTNWLKVQAGFLAILQQNPFEIYARFDHTMAQQEAFRQALETKLAQNPDDMVKKDILSTDFMTLKAVSAVPTPPSGQVALYPDSATGKIFAKKSDGTTVDLEATGSGGSGDVYAFKTTDQTLIGTAYTDVTGTGLAVAANTNYEFEFNIIADADAATTGIDIACNGPAIGTGTITYTCAYWTSATVQVFKAATAYDFNTASTASAGTTRCIYRVFGILRNGANAGTLVARIKRENVGTGPNARAGSYGRIKAIP